MAITEHPVCCDVCGKDRRTDANHWWVLWEWRMAPGTPTGIAMVPFSLEEAVKPERAHACGVSHSSVLLERFMTFGSLFTRTQEINALKH